MGTGKLIAYRLDPPVEREKGGRAKSQKNATPEEKAQLDADAARTSACVKSRCRRYFANPLGRPWCSPW